MNPTRRAQFMQAVRHAYTAWRNVFALYTSAFTKNALAEADSNLQAAVKAFAEVEASIYVHDRMASFFDARVRSIDPHEDAWAFADAWQKKRDNLRERSLKEQRLAVAARLVATCEQRLAHAISRHERVDRVLASACSSETSVVKQPFTDSPSLSDAA